MTTRTFPVTVGSLELTARAEIAGKFRPAVTQADPNDCYPAEFPEIDVRELWTRPPAFSDVCRVDMLGLLDDEDILEQVEDQILNTLADEHFNGAEE